MEPLSRRGLLQLAALAALAPARGWAERAKAKQLLVVWLEGGPSQLETFDPHPGSKVGGLVGAVKTRVEGLQLASFYPQLAEEVHRLSVIRSLTSKEGDHERATYTLKTGHRPEGPTQHPALTAITSELLRGPRLGIPNHVSLVKSQWPAKGGILGAERDAFRVASPGDSIGNLESRLAEAPRVTRRRDALESLNSSFARGHGDTALRHRQTIDAAQTMMASEELAAFRLDGESRAARAAYGDTPFGRGCLVARRLLERGVPAVEVTLSGFDSHASNHEAHREQAQVLDPALATLLRELDERGLLASTVVWVAGEFGRTPRINAAGGRDHWPQGFSCLLGGGGLRAGAVLGATDPTGEQKEPARPVPVEDVSATILSALGVPLGRTFDAPDGRPIPVTKGKPLEELV
jgi:uncharacterized protein (DUF1501 family)